MSSGIALSGERVSGLAVARGTVSTNQTTTATSSGTSTVLMTAGPAAFLGGTYAVELQSPGVTKGTTTVTLELWVDGAFNQSIVASYVNATAITPFFWRGVITLNPGVHTITVRGFVDAGTGTLTAGAGTTGNQPNAVLSVYPG